MTTKNQEITLAFFFLPCVFPFAFPPRPPKPLLLLQRPEKMVDQIAEKIAREKYKKVRMLFAFLERRRRQERRGRRERRGEKRLRLPLAKEKKELRSARRVSAAICFSQQRELIYGSEFRDKLSCAKKEPKEDGDARLRDERKTKTKKGETVSIFTLSRFRGRTSSQSFFFWKPLKIPFKPLSSSLFLFSLTKTGVLRAQQDPEEEGQRLPPRGVSQNFDEGSVKEEVKYEEKTLLFFVLERKKHRHSLFRLLSPFLSARGRDEMR